MSEAQMITPAATAEEGAEPVEPTFAVGVKSLFGGIAWLAKTPPAWPMAAVPIAIATLITAGLSYGCYTFIPDWVAGAVGPAGGMLATIGIGVLKVVATALGVVVSVLIAFALAQPLSGPALEQLVRRQEAALGLPARPPTHFVSDILRSLQSLAVGYAFGLPALALLFVLSLIVPVASIVLFPLKLLVASFTVAWDICDYPLSIRGLPVGKRVALMRRYKGAILGFAVALALAGLVPCVLFLFLPGGVAGAARLMCAIERWEQSQGHDLFEAPAPAAGQLPPTG